MSFHSLEFLIFFGVGVTLYILCPPRYRWVWLLALSYTFYAAWGIEYVILIVVSTLVAYVLAIVMARTSLRARRKALLVLGLTLNLGLLGVLKYAGFFSDSLRALFGRFGLPYDVPALQLLLPVGLSFYTFKMSSYLIDVYRDKIEPERHLGLLALFISFFPQLVAGPIDRAGHLLPQLHVKRDLSAASVTGGLRLMLWGLFKKVVIADHLAVYVDAVYNNPADHRGLPVILATYFFAVQIYCDFSGYSDIALGAARVMGYNLTLNFRRPYYSTSIAEFWRRWHISLSSWFRDYLYIPLGGSRVPKWRWYTNLMVVFVLSGLWHGANWTFVLWGGLHGLYYLLEAWTRKARDAASQVLHPSIRPAVGTAAGMFLTLNLVCFAWLFFRADSVQNAFLLLRNMVQIGASTSVYAPWTSYLGSPALEMAFSLGLIALLAGIGLLHEHQAKAFPAIWQSGWVRWAVYLLLALAVLNLGMAKETPFIYLQF